MFTSRTFYRWLSILLFAMIGLTVPVTPGIASELFQEALYHANEGRLDHAIDLWTRFIQRHPNSYAAYANRGAAHLWTGHVYKGILDWHTAKELSPLFAYALYSGRFLPEVTQNSAMLNYAMSLELEPDYFPSVLMTGSLFLDVGKRDKAIAMFRKSVDLTKNPLLKGHFEHWVESLESTSEE
jgi:tetratricopeptide (TPR) repeat protein